MERQINRLENLLQQKEKIINNLNIKTRQLEEQISANTILIKSLNEKLKNDFSYTNVSNHDIMKTLETKIGNLAWQITQLKKDNHNYSEHILKLQQELLKNQQKAKCAAYIINQQTFATSQTSSYDQSFMNQQLKRIQNYNKQKIQLMSQNLILKQMLKSKQSDINEKLAFFLNQAMDLSGKLKNSYQNGKSNSVHYENLIKKFEKENTQLQQKLKKKNEQLLLITQQIKMVSTSKASDMHTIRNLRQQLKKKNQNIMEISEKIKQIQILKKKLTQYSTQFGDSIGQNNKIFENYQKLKIQNGLLQQKLKQQQLRNKQQQKTIQDSNKKIYDLLLQNQCCHQILYESRGYSNIFKKDIQQKINQHINRIQRRKQQNWQSWQDITELITVNQKLRSLLRDKNQIY